jgi:ABC-2 type transport system permease protein
MTWVPGSLTPAPAAAPRLSMLAAQTTAEITMTLRKGEQLLLNLVIPIGLLVVLTQASFIEVKADSRADFYVPGIFALAIMSSAFTGQAIATGFERQYGVLKRLGATPLPRSVLMQAKTLGVLAIQVLQLGALAAVGLALGWDPRGSILAALAFIALGTAAFSGLGLLLGGTLRGMTTLAVANLLWFVLLLLGGMVFPLEEYGGLAGVLELLPTAALAHGLRTLMVDGVTTTQDLVVLAGWAVVALAAAARAFRWE